MTQENQTIYTILVDGIIDPQWSDWLGALSIRVQTTTDGINQTILCGPIPDQAALRGILTQIWDLNLELISVERIREGTGKEKSSETTEAVRVSQHN